MRCIFLLLLASFAIAGPPGAVTPNPKLLQDRVPVSRLAGEQGEGVTFKIEVPPGAENFVVKTTSGAGDMALYLRYNAHPTPTDWDFTSDNDDANETTELIRLGTLVAGTWYVRVIGMTAFRGVKLTASYDLPRGVPKPPRIVPAPGSYPERVVVRMLHPRGTTVRYTTNDTAPDVNSPIYTGPITLTSSTKLRAVTFGRDGTPTIETVADYTIVAAGTVQALNAGTPVHHLGAVRGKAHQFKLTVPAGTPRLLVKMEGGPGDAQLFAKAGAMPTTREFSHRARGPGNNATLSITNPAAGDWFFHVPARLGYSGVSLLATTRSAGVDLIAWGPVLEPYVTTESFSAGDPEDPVDGDCEVEEGMITAGMHKLLRFHTQTRNVGTEDLQLGDPEGKPGFEYFECHEHYHFNGFASYELLDVNGQPVALGRKVSFCLLDGERWDPKAPALRKYHCNNQGIQAGWSDIYDAGLPGQWIEITGVPPGTYTLVITMNPDQLITETDYTNNSASTQVVIEP